MALSDVSWKGLKALEVMADVLPTKIAGPKLRKAYRYALTPTRTQMRENIPHIRSKALWYATDITIGGTQELQQMYGLVGPRRKKSTWNQKGFHAHMIEAGTKEHKIPKGTLTRVLGAKKMPVFTSAGFTGAFARQITHKGSKAYRPFQRGIDSTWRDVADRVSNKVADIMRGEIKSIFIHYGQVVTKSGSII